MFTLTTSYIGRTSGRCITQLAKMSIDPKAIELTAGVFIIFSQYEKLSLAARLKSIFLTGGRLLCSTIYELLFFRFVQWTDPSLLADRVHTETIEPLLCVRNQRRNLHPTYTCAKHTWPSQLLTEYIQICTRYIAPWYIRSSRGKM